MTTPKIATPLIIGTAIVVTAFGGANVVLAPERILTWLLGILFLPAAMTGLYVLTRRKTAPRLGPKAVGGARAALVGAGAVLAMAFGFSAMDALGWTGEDGQFSAKPIMVFLLPAIVVLADTFGDRLAKVAEKDPDTD